jgi:hypothetical protein
VRRKRYLLRPKSNKPVSAYASLLDAYYLYHKICLQEKTGKATEQKEEKREKPKPEEREGITGKTQSILSLPYYRYLQVASII